MSTNSPDWFIPLKITQKVSQKSKHSRNCRKGENNGSQRLLVKKIYQLSNAWEVNSEFHWTVLVNDPNFYKCKYMINILSPENEAYISAISRDLYMRSFLHWSTIMLFRNWSSYWFSQMRLSARAYRALNCPQKNQSTPHRTQLLNWTPYAIPTQLHIAANIGFAGINFVLFEWQKLYHPSYVFLYICRIRIPKTRGA